MALFITNEKRRILSPESLANLQQAIDDVEAQAHIPSNPNLKQQILDFIYYFKQKLAHPFQWTFKSKLLAV